MLRLVACGLLGTAAAVAEAPAGDPLVVQTSAGAVRGVQLGGYRAFRGIPYAAPPVGDLRFRPPRPHPGWEGVLDALDFGASCYQKGSPFCWNTLNASRMSEDCLTINVFTPSKVGTKPWPVMIYIHAGEFRCGSSNDLESNFPSFADDIVMVSFNFRLGALGFLALDELRSRHPEGGTGNYGMLDQRQALEWVQANIAAFGGEPTLVSIWGESSGGTSVAYHLTANGRAPTQLFRRAILQSPGLTQVKSWEDGHLNSEYALAALAASGSPKCAQSPGYLELPDNQLSTQTPLAVLQNLTLDAAEAWCNSNSTCMGFWRAGTMTTFVPSFQASDIEAYGQHGVTSFVRRGPATPEDRVQCLLAANSQNFAAISLAVPRDDTFSTDAWGPVIDGVDLKETILEKVAKGELAEGVDILAGANLDDGTEFMFLVPPLKCTASHEEFQAWLAAFHGPELAPKVEAAYKPEALERPLPSCQAQYPPGPKVDGETALFYNAGMRSAGDRAVACPTRRLVQRASGRAFLYNFKLTPAYSMNFDDTSTMGAFHGAEIPFVFGDAFELKTDAERALAKAMQCYWRSFVYHGEPDREPCAQAVWPAFNTSGGPTMGLAVQVEALAEDQLTKQRCELFDGATNHHGLGGSAISAAPTGIVQFVV